MIAIPIAFVIVMLAIVAIVVYLSIYFLETPDKKD